MQALLKTILNWFGGSLVLALVAAGLLIIMLVCVAVASFKAPVAAGLFTFCLLAIAVFALVVFYPRKPPTDPTAEVRPGGFA